MVMLARYGCSAGARSVYEFRHSAVLVIGICDFEFVWDL
jgi:hypothetical protein